MSGGTESPIAFHDPAASARATAIMAGGTFPVGQTTKRSAMPARVVVVHDEQDFVDEVVSALRSAGYEVTTFPDPMAAWDALKAAQRTEVLVTRVEFQPGRSNGVALARMARTHRPGMRVLFTAMPEHASHTDGLGTFMPLPASVPDVVDAVTRLLMSEAEEAL